jgi:hypothetical protein
MPAENLVGLIFLKSAEHHLRRTDAHHAMAWMFRPDLRLSDVDGSAGDKRGEQKSSRHRTLSGRNAQAAAFRRRLAGKEPCTAAAPVVAREIDSAAD